MAKKNKKQINNTAISNKKGSESSYYNGWSDVYSMQGSATRDTLESTQLTIDARYPHNYLFSLYRQNDTFAKIIDLIVDDSLKKDIHIESAESPEAKKAVRDMFESLDVIDMIARAQKLARVHGGSLWIPAIEYNSSNLVLAEEPLNLDQIKAIGKGFILHAGDYTPGRMEGNSFQEFSQSPYQPITHYRYTKKTGGFVYIHQSKVFVFHGKYKGLDNQIANQGHYEPVLTADLEKAIRGYDLVCSKPAHLSKFMAIPSIGLDGLRDMVGDVDTAKALGKEIFVLLQNLSTYGILYRDKNDDFNFSSATLTGFKDLESTAKLYLCSKTAYPHTRFFNESPGSTLSGGGDSQMNDYYDAVQVLQNSYTKVINRLVDIFCSILNIDPFKVEWEFLPLRQPTEKEQAETEDKKASSVQKMVQSWQSLIDMGLPASIIIDSIMNNHEVQEKLKIKMDSSSVDSGLIDDLNKVTDSVSNE